EGGYLDPRRRPKPSGALRTMSRAQLAALLGPLQEEIESLATRFEAQSSRTRAATSALEARSVEIQQRIEAVVRDYNDAPEGLREGVLAELDVLTGQLGKLTRRVARIERPLSEAAFALTRAREEARRLLDLQLHPSPQPR